MTTTATLQPIVCDC